MDVEEVKTHEIKWRLTNALPDFRDKQVKGQLRMPSDIPKGYKGEWDCPPVTLDLHDDSEDTAYALTIMRESCSSNILSAKLVVKDKSYVLAWVEPFTGNLLEFLESKRLGISEHQGPNSAFTLPTPNLDSALQQVLKGFGDLWKSGNCHGGFSLEKTYYFMDASGIKIKLCNFKRKKGTFKENLAEDVTAFKNGLLKIREIATELKKIRFRRLDCCQLDGLIDVLRNIALSDAQSALQVIKRQPFFWGKEERRVFFLWAIPLALSKGAFLSKVKNAKFISLPWGKNGYDGFLEMMNNYRATKGYDPYNTTCRVDFVKFISGLYTHEAELKAVISVDATVQAKNPGLSYHLYTLLPSGT